MKTSTAIILGVVVVGGGAAAWYLLARKPAAAPPKAANNASGNNYGFGNLGDIASGISKLLNSFGGSGPIGQGRADLPPSGSGYSQKSDPHPQPAPGNYDNTNPDNTTDTNASGDSFDNPYYGQQID